MANPPLSYRSGPAAARSVSPSEFDHAYEQERGRWLRRRFLYYAGFSIVVGLLVALPMLIYLLGKNNAENMGWRIAVILLSNAVYIAAFVIAWRSRPVYSRVLRVALATYLFASLLAIGFSHLSTLWSADEFKNGFLQGMSTAADHPAGGSTRIRLDTSTSAPAAVHRTPSDDLFGGKLRYSYIEPATTKIGSVHPTFTLPWAVDNLMYGIIWSTLLFSLTFNHLLISLFLPWTVRDSLRPALCIAGAFLFMVLVDTFVGVAWWPFAMVALVLLPFTFAPGTIVCWWRYSRFHKQFRQQFESLGFRKLQDELVGARRIHEANLPAPIAEGPVRVAYEYEPMREIGGDLLMLHRSRNNNTVTAVLFDVTGHGVSAALSVNRIVGEIERTFAEDADASPERLICNLNKYIAAILSKHGIYATAIVARIDAANGTLDYVNAGHPPAVLARAGSEDAHELQPTAMMLGVFDGEEFECRMVTLPFAAGDAIVLYTDGASEAIDPHDTMLGLHGTFSMITDVITTNGDPKRWPEALRDRIVEFRQSPPTDDTLIVAMWRG